MSRYVFAFIVTDQKLSLQKKTRLKRIESKIAREAASNTQNTSKAQNTSKTQKYFLSSKYS